MNVIEPFFVYIDKLVIMIADPLPYKIFLEKLSNSSFQIWYQNISKSMMSCFIASGVDDHSNPHIAGPFLTLFERA